VQASRARTELFAQRFREEDTDDVEPMDARTETATVKRRFRAQNSAFKTFLTARKWTF